MQDEKDRTPPAKIRITKLQEAQVDALVQIETQCAAMHYALGLSEDTVAPRGEMAIGKLPRSHDVLVAEADDEVAGYLVWADHAPGVAWIDTLMVAPEYQRFGVATRLLREFGESATGHGIRCAAARCSDAALWALAFLSVRGFLPMDGPLPDKISVWREQHSDLALPGFNLWYRETDGLGKIPGLPRPS